MAEKQTNFFNPLPSCNFLTFRPFKKPFRNDLVPDWSTSCARPPLENLLSLPVENSSACGHHRKMLRKSTTAPEPRIQRRIPSSFDLRPVKRPQIKTYLNKSYVLVRSVHYERFLESLGVDRETIKNAAKLKPVLTLTKTDDTYNLTTEYDSHLPPQNLKFRIGEQIIKTTPDGRQIKCLFDITENKLIENQDHDGRQLTIKRKFTDTELLITMEFNGLRCHRYYKSIRSNHTIGTETSRRQSLIRKQPDLPLLTPPSEETLIENVFLSETESEDLCL